MVATLVGSLFVEPFVHHVWEPFIYAVVLGVSFPGRSRLESDRREN